MGTQHSSQSKINFFKIHFSEAHKRGTSLNKERLIAQFILTQFSTRRKALEIIKVFETAGIIQIVGTEIAHPSIIAENSNILPTKQKSLTEAVENGN